MSASVRASLSPSPCLSLWLFAFVSVCLIRLLCLSHFVQQSLWPFHYGAICICPLSVLFFDFPSPFSLPALSFFSIFSLRLFVSLSLPLFLSVCLCFCLSFHPSVCVCISVDLFVCESTCNSQRSLVAEVRQWLPAGECIRFFSLSPHQLQQWHQRIFIPSSPPLSCSSVHPFIHPNFRPSRYRFAFLSRA